VDGYLYCLDYQTGQLHWKFKTDKPITATPAAFGDTILIGSTDKRFYALPAKAFH
jgi:outer membrane protein assembly factor BamB